MAAGPAAPHLCTPVSSPCLNPLAPETTSPEQPGGPQEPQPPAVPSQASQVPLCSSLRQPNRPNQRTWGGGTLLPTAHRGTELCLSSWLLMPARPTGSKAGLQEGQGRCLDQEGGGAEPRKMTESSPKGMWHAAAPTPTLRLQ